MHKNVITFFDEGLASGLKWMRCQEEETVEKGHGRIGCRHYWLVADPEYLAYLNPKEAWSNLRGVGMVQTEHEVEGVVTAEKRYY